MGLLTFLGAVPTALAYGLFFVGLATVRAATAGVISLVEPVVAAIVGVCLFGERLTGTAVFGIAVLMTSVAALIGGEGQR